MTFFHHHIDQLVGLLLVVYSLCLFIIRPKFGSKFYGIATKWTLINETVWLTGQKLFAIAIGVIGIIFFAIGSLKIHEEIADYTKFFILAALWITAKYFVHIFLKSKCRNTEA